MDDLVERLQRKIVAINGRHVDPAVRDTWGKRAFENPDGPEAADRIEKLEAENAELQHQIEIRDAAAVSRANLSDNRGVRP